MTGIFSKLFRKLVFMTRLQGDAGVIQLGHRKYVGGRWDEIGRLQFEFMLAQGLQPHHYLLDIACGAL